MSASALPEVLHYVGCDDDRGGVISVIRALAGSGQFDCVLGVNAGARQERRPALPQSEWPRVVTEKIGGLNALRARRVARAVQAWLRVDARRIFHGHSRAGLLVALWLHGWGERRVVLSVHCYGRQRWFYRWVARRLGDRLFWLSPAMKKYYHIGDDTWAQCISGCVPASQVVRGPAEPSRLRLGGIGALVGWKNWSLVLAALARLPAERRAAVTFTHIGGEMAGSGRGVVAALRAETARLGLARQVVWRGAEPSAQGLLGEIDCLVIASHAEPFSMAMLEALAAGVPVLAADSGGAVDIIQPGINGWLFRSGEATDLAARLENLLRESTVARLDPAAIRRTACTVPDVAARWREVYRAVLAG